MTNKSWLSGLLFALLVLTTAATARATTIVAMTDEDLTLSARAIVEGRVVSAEQAWDAGRGAVFTYVTLDVERAYKGDVPPGLVVLKQLGGTTERASTIVHGSPALEAGQRVLLFLNTDSEGALRVAHLSLGHFRLVADAAAGVDVVVRPHTDAVVMKDGRAGESTDRATHAAFVSALLATLAANPEAVAGYDAAHVGTPVLLVPREYEPGAKPATSNFTFLGSGFRWFEPDTNAKVRFKVNRNGGPTPSGGLDESKAALAAWSSVSGSSLRMEYAGSSSGGGLKGDGESVIAFGDPRNEIDAPVNCSGVVGQGGITRTSSESTTINGKRFYRIVEGDLIIADGFECLLSNSTVLAEVLTHELGHTLGFGHSSENANEQNAVLFDATMYYRVHNDGRGAAVRKDDVDATRFLYRSPVAPLEIMTTALPDAKPGAGYVFPLRASGGSGQYSWSVTSGALPSGMSLTADGRITGPASASGSASFTVRVRDGASNEETHALSLRVTPTPAPFLETAAYQSAKGKLTLRGYNLSEGAAVEVNGRDVSSRPTRFNAAKRQLKVTGSASELNLRTSNNSVVVLVDGRRSNALRF
jgi:hypothetical protein